MIESIHQEFERAWSLDHPPEAFPAHIWLQRAGDDGYVEAAVHSEWERFKKGVAYGIWLARVTPA